MGLLGRSTSLSKILYQLYWEQFVLPINYMIYHIKFSIFRIHKRSTQSLITVNIKTFDTKGEMERLERIRDDMEEFVKMVPDECLIDLADKVYCTGKK